MANFSFVCGSVSNTSEERTYVVFLVSNFSVLSRYSILVYQTVNINGYYAGQWHVSGYNCITTEGGNSLSLGTRG